MRRFWGQKALGVTREDVHAAYCLVLKREPESEAAIAFHLKHESTSALINTLLHSEEFAQMSKSSSHVGSRGWQRLSKPLAVEYDHRDKVMLNELFGCVQQTWEAWGCSDPHFSVLTHPQYRVEKLVANEATFYAEATFDADLVASALARANGGSASLLTCVEYGCGVGRATWKLASMFKEVHAFDISRPHLELARQWLDAQGTRNVRLKHLSALADLDGGEYDFWFSRLVLQHNPPPLSLAIIAISLRHLRAGGLALFQIPTYVEGYSFRAEDYLSAFRSEATIETHCVPQSAILREIEASGCEVLEALEDADPGMPETIASYTFLARRRDQEF